MKKFWYIMLHEYARHVFRWRFAFTLLSLPALLFVALLVFYVLNRQELDPSPIGLVDYASLFEGDLPFDRSITSFPIIRFNKESQAKEALLAEQIQAYYVLEADYLQTSRARLVAAKRLGIYNQAQFSQFIQAKLLENQPPQVVARLRQGNHMIARTSDGTQQVTGGEFIRIVTPIVALFVFMLAIFTTSGYLVQALTEEKENRTMEVVITSVSHEQLLAGKTIAIVGIGLTQLLVWFGIFFIVISLRQKSFEWVRGFGVSTELVWLFVLTLLLAFIMIAAIMATIGAMVTEATEGQQITGPFSLPFIIPYFFIFSIMANPQNSLAVAFSLIPFTSPVTLIIRLSVAVVPDWQILLGLSLQAIFTLCLVWLAGKAFKMGMLNYGRRLSLWELFRRPTSP